MSRNSMVKLAGDENDLLAESPLFDQQQYASKPADEHAINI